MQRFLRIFMLTALFLPFALQAQNSWTVADGTTTHAAVPLDFYNCDGSGVRNAQMLYPASLLTEMNGSTIGAVTFYHQSSATKTLSSTTWYIMMGTTTETDLSAGFSTAALDTVYAGSLSVVNGTITFEFNTPYTYNGGNLVVEIYTTGVTGNWFGNSNQGCYGVDNIGSTYSSMSNPSHTAFLPKTTFTAAPSCLPVSGVAVDGSQTTTSSLTLTWTDANNSGATYSVYDMSDNSLVASGISGTTYTVGNLASNTTYTFGVEANCSATDAADLRTVSGRTACDTETTPWSEDFDSWSGKSDCWKFLSGALSGNPVPSSSAWALDYSYGTHITIDGKALTMNVFSTRQYWAVTPPISIANDDILLSVDVAVAAWSAAAPSFDADDTLAFAISTDDGATFTPLLVYGNAQINALGNTYTTVNIPVSGYNGQTVRFAIFGGSSASGGDNRLVIDNISVDEAPDCLPASGLAASDITIDAATLSWSGNAYEYNLYYKLAGDTAWMEILGVTDTSYALSGLAAAATYQWQVASLCNDGSESAPTTSIFSTLCEAITITDQDPWTENFSSEPSCWTLPTNDGETFSWSDNTLGHDFGEYEIEAVSPVLDITFVSTPYLKFDQLRADYMASGIADELYVYFRSTEEGTDSAWILLQSYTDIANIWTFDSLPLPMYQTTIQLKFRAVGNGMSADGCHLDNVSVYNEENAPACLPPVGLTVLGTTSNSADLSWTASGAGMLNLYYKTSADTGYTMVQDVTLTEGAYTLDNLNAASTYQWNLGIVCADGSTVYSSSATFTTECGAVNVPYFQGFEGYPNMTIPECWGKINEYQSYAGSYPGVTSSSSMVYEGERSLQFMTDNTTPQYAVMPAFATPLNELQVNFWTRREGASSGTFSVGYMTDPTAESTFTALWSTSGALIGDNSFHNYTVKFDSIAGSGTYHIAFKYESSEDWYWYIDNVNVTLIPNCAMPENLTTGNLTTTSADLFWSGNSAQYTLFYKTATDSVYTEVTNVSLDASGTYTLDNLIPGTSYSWYVAAQCDDGTTTASITSGNFNTKCLEINSIPVTWDFESDLYGGTPSYPLPSCWQKAGTGTTYPYVNSNNAHSGDKKLYFYNSYSSAFAVMPAVDTDVLPLNGLQVSFYAKLSSSSYQAPLEFGVMTDPADMSTFTALGTLDLTTDYALYEFLLTGYTGTGKHIAFHVAASGTAYNYIYVDDVTLEAIPACSRPMSLAADPDTASAALTWSSTASDFTLYYKESTDTVWTIVNGVSLDANGEYVLTDLSALATYDWYVETACPGEEQLASAIAHFATTRTAAALPYQTTFATAADWTITNGDCVNYWVAGTPAGETETALFVTNDGTTAAYSVSNSAVVVAEKLFLTPNTDSLHVEFDVKVGGEGASTPYDYLKVFLAPSGETFEASPSGSNAQSNYSYSQHALNFADYKSQTGGSSSYPYILNLTQNNTIHVSVDMAVPSTNGKAKLVFLWKNDNSSGAAPGAIIRNLSITATGSDTTIVLTDPTVATNAATAIAQTTATLNGTITNPDNVTISAKGFQWKTTTGGTYQTVNATGTGLSYNLTGLTAATGYTFRAFITFNGQTVYGNEMTFTTLNEDTPEPCNTPTGLTVASVENHAVTVTWDANSNVNSWNIRYRKANEGSWNSAASNTNSYTISNLDGNTDYEIQVQADCGDGNQSDWTASATAHTTNVGISSWMENSVKVFPNPANAMLNVQCSMGDEAATIELLDVTGKLLRTISATGETTILNISTLADGMYFVRVTTDEDVVTKTFVVKR